MRTYVFERDVLGVTTKGVAVRNASLVRALPFGSNWNKIRIGLRFIWGWDTTGGGAGVFPAEAERPNYTPRFQVGVTSGTGGMVAGSIDHFFGYTTISSAWSVVQYGSKWMGWALGSNGGRMSTQIGSTVTTYGSGISSGSAGWPGYSGTVAQPYHATALYMQIEKGTTWWGKFAMCLSPAWASGITQAAWDSARFRSAVENGDIDDIDGSGGLDNSYQTSNTAATPTIDEVTNGYMDSVLIYWDRIIPVLEVFDVYVKKVN